MTTPPPGMLEHPQCPGLFYDASIVYVRTGDAAKDLAHRLMMMEHTGCIPQTFVIGGAINTNTPSSKH